MKLRNPDRTGVEIVAVFTAVIVLLVLALVVADYFNVH
jgi:hypothetical protein